MRLKLDFFVQRILLIALPCSSLTSLLCAQPFVSTRATVQFGQSSQSDYYGTTRIDNYNNGSAVCGGATVSWTQQSSPGVIYGVLAGFGTQTITGSTAAAPCTNPNVYTDSRFQDTVTVHVPGGVQVRVEFQFVLGANCSSGATGTVWGKLSLQDFNGGGPQTSSTCASSTPLSTGPITSPTYPRFNFAARLETYASGVGLPGAQADSQTAAFTARLTNIIVTDMAGHPVTGYTFSSDSGTDYMAQVNQFSGIRVHGGDLIYRDPQGNHWYPDADALAAANSTYDTFVSGIPIANTDTPSIYQSERFPRAGNTSLAYNFAVPNGTYNVKLKFAEIYFSQPGRRVFNATINGAQALSNFDIVAAAGAPNTAIDRLFAVTVSNGQIAIQLNKVVSNPKISGIEILQAVPDLVLAPTAVTLAPGLSQSFTPAVVGTVVTGVTWSISPAGAGSVSLTGTYTAPATFNPAVRTVKVLATSQADNTVIASATVALVDNWQTQDIGSPSFAGAFSYSTGAYSVSGGGDVYGDSDSFRFAWQQLTGDGSITARLIPQVDFSAAQSSKAGVMFRASTDPSAVHAFMSIYSDIVGLVESRTAAGGSTNIAFGGTGVYWLKLIRQGNTFTGYLSAEGISWIPVGSPMSIPSAPSTMLVGLAVSGAGYATSFPALFDNVSVSGPVVVSVDQQLAAMGNAQASQFSATVLGASDSSVTWSVSPPLGSINQTSGLYTAPDGILSRSSVTVTATSNQDHSKSSSAVVNLSTAELGVFQAIRVNAGGPSTIDGDGVSWHADSGATTGNIFSSGANIIGTATEKYLYQTERFGLPPSPGLTPTLTYRYIVPNGTYRVTLKFAEIYFTSPNQRLFSVSVNGNPVAGLQNVDLVQQVGANTIFDRTFFADVSNGQILIQLTGGQIAGVLSTPKISAISIDPAGLTTPPKH